MNLLDGLASPDAEVRRLSVEQLSLLSVDEALPHLAERLGDADWRVRKAVVARVQPFLERPAVQEMLVTALADTEDPGRRNAAFEALAAGGAKVAPRLTRELASPDVDVRKLVVDALAEIGDPASRDALVAMTGDPDINVRSAAVEALGFVGGTQEINHLLGIVRECEQDVLVRLSSLRALSRMGVSVGASSVGSAVDVALLRPSAFALFAYSEDRAAIEALLKGLGDGNRSGREAAMAALLQQICRLDELESDRLRDEIRMACEGLPGLIEGACARLETGNLETRMVMIQFLGILGPVEAVAPILKCGKDDAIEELALATLENFGDRVPAALEPLWDALDGDSKRRACDLLGRLADPCSERMLASALESHDPELRCAAASALGQGGFSRRLPDLLRTLEKAAKDHEVETAEEVSVLIRAIVRMAERAESVDAGLDIQIIEALASRLGGAPEAVRIAIAQVLGRLGRARDRDLIEYLLKDESPPVRRAAVGALTRFDFDVAREFLRLALGDESITVRTAAARVLGEIDAPEVEDELTRLLSDGDGRLVSVALRSLGRFYGRGADASGGAVDLVASHLHGDALVALAATEALGEIGGAAAARALEPALTRVEPEVIRSATSAIGRNGDEEILASLLSVVNHEEWSVRAEAARALSDRGYRKGLPSLLRRLELEDDAFVREVILRAIDRLDG